MFIKLCLCVCLFACVSCEYYDTYTGLEITQERFEALRNRSLVPFCAKEIDPCNPWEPRRMDLSCYDLKRPSRGASLTPFHRMLPPRLNQSTSAGAPLPPARALRVAILSDGRASSPRHTQMVAHFTVYLTGEVTSVHDTVHYGALTDCCSRPTPRCANIPVAADDVHLRRSAVRCLNLTAPVTYQDLGCVGGDQPPARINLAAPMLDLSGVYGHQGQAAIRGRVGLGGRLRAEPRGGRDWPAAGGSTCINNERQRGETRCHDYPASGSNSVLGVNLVAMWFYRQHNHIARRLQKLNPCWDDNKLYFEAREINIAYFNQILYYELMPEVLGYEYMLKNGLIYSSNGPFDEYDEEEEPSVSVEYIMGTRWFHSVQEGRLKYYTSQGEFYDEKALVDLTLRTGALTLNNTVGGVTQGAFRQPGAAADGLVDPDVGERILGRLQFASDVISADIMKGRLMFLPTFNDYRRLCGLPPALSWADLERLVVDKQQIDALSRHYALPEDVEAMVGLYVERAAGGALAGDTLACALADQLRRWRRADRHWYERTFSSEQLYEIRKISMSKVLCAHGDDVDSIQPNSFVLPGPGNEMKLCSEYEMPDLSVFQDYSCQK